RDMRRLLLAHRAEERRAPGLHDALDRALAARRRAWLALAVVDAEVVLEQAELAGCLPVVAQRGAAGPDRIVEHRLDGIHKALGALVRGARFHGERGR